MATIFLHINENGNVIITVPAPEFIQSHGLDWIQQKDTPKGSVAVDDSTVPFSDIDFIEAWRLNGSTISIDMPAAILIQQDKLNSIAKTEAQHRLTNTSIGLTNQLNDTAWLDLLTTARSAIQSATTTQELVNAIVPVQQAIDANK